MKYLLDTHTLFWFLDSPERVTPPVRALLTDPANDLLLSIATPWELAIKTNASRSFDARHILEQMDFITGPGGYKMLETEVSHVIRAGLLPLIHRDPFDRLIAAQAIDLGLTVLSCDDIFDRYGIQRIWN
jgi:PIN domain nuclease of toxin-antitoxin system